MVARGLKELACTKTIDVFKTMGNAAAAAAEALGRWYEFEYPTKTGDTTVSLNMEGHLVPVFKDYHALVMDWRADLIAQFGFNVGNVHTFWDGHGCVVLHVVDLLENYPKDREDTGSSACMGALRKCKAVFRDGSDSIRIRRGNLGVSAYPSVPIYASM